MENQRKNSLLVQEILACPSCKKKLFFKGDVITCNSCGGVYSKENGIFLMIKDMKLSSFDKEQRQVFDKISANYDKYLYGQPLYVSIKKDYVYPYWFKNDFEGKIVMDIGCGTGWGGEKILEHCGLLINLDISINNLIFAKNKLGNKNSIYIQANINELPFSNDSFDIVTCFWALHHIQYPPMAVKEISRVLNKKGIFLGIEPNIRYTWVDFWSDALNLPFFLRKIINKFHKRIQKVTKKRLDKEEWYMRGIDLKEDHHAGIRTPDEFRNYVEEVYMKMESLDIGLEIVPPRFFMSKSKTVVKFLLKLSNWVIRNFNKKGKGMFYIIKATK